MVYSVKIILISAGITHLLFATKLSILLHHKYRQFRLFVEDLFQ